MKKSTIALILGLVLIVGGAYAGYNLLQNKDAPVTTSEQPVTTSEQPVTTSEQPVAGPENNKPVAGDQKSAEANPQNGRPVVSAPDFTVFDKDGNKVKFSDFKGKPVVINFWASWCSFCKVEMPDFQKVYDKYKGERIEFMMVAGTDGKRETRESADNFLNENGYTFPVYYDEGLMGRDNLDILESANAAYMVSGYPSTAFVDSDGNLIGVYTGALDEARLTKLVEFIMDEANNGKTMEDALK